MPDVDEDVRKVTRFPKGADDTAKRKFASDLIAALNQLGIDPGEDFIVAPLQESLRPEEADEEKADELRREEHVAVLLALFDFKREMIDLDELIERVLYALRGIITGKEYPCLSEKDHALMGLPHTGGLGS